MLQFVPEIDENIENVVTLLGEIGTFNTTSTDKLVTNKNYINGLYFQPDSKTFNNSWKVTLKGVKEFDTLKELIKKHNEANSSNTYSKLRCVIKGMPTNANYKNNDEITVYQQAIDVHELTIVNS